MQTSHKQKNAIIEPTQTVNFTVCPIRELNLRSGNTFKEPVNNQKKLDFLKGSRERANFKILPTNGASACWKICWDKRQLDLVSEKRQIVDRGKINIS